MARTPIDLTGQRFGRLVVVRFECKEASSPVLPLTYRWLCRCDCGTEKVVAASSLRSGHVKSCGGCVVYTGTRTLDLAGQRFGRLTVLTPAGTNRRHGATWTCRCDCGNETVVDARNLRAGNTKSCGCLKAEYFASLKRAGTS